MPIYLRFPDSIKGKVNAEGHLAAGGATGGVWKTTNFLTTDPGTVSLARISLANGFMAVDGRDALPKRKVEILFETARMGTPNGRLYVATNVGVFSKVDSMGRLLVGTEGGLWRSTHNTGALRNVSGNNYKPGVGILKSTDAGKTWNASSRPMVWDILKNAPFQGHVVEIVAADAGSASGRAFRLRNARISDADPNGNAIISFTGLE